MAGKKSVDLTVHILREIRDELRTGFTAVNDRLDQTNARLDRTNARLDRTNARLENIRDMAGSAIGTWTRGVRKLEGRVDRLAARK
jgi:hypothetical protein